MSIKRILIYSQAFYPDHSGIPIYASDFAFYCAENGYEVDVITGFPFYPQWKKQKVDKKKLFGKEAVKGITIYRGYLYVTTNPSPFQRIIHELSLVFFAFLNSFRVKSPDIIIVFTTPVLLGLLGAVMNLFWRKTLIINVQDFQVEAAYSLGMLNKSFVLKIINKLEVWSYKQAHFVSSISASMVDLLIEKKKVSEYKALFWPNWLRNNKIHKNEVAKDTFRRKFNISDKIQLIGYAGNIGKKQGLDIFIDVASEFYYEHNLLFLIIGEGADLQRLKQYAENKSVKNILFIPFLDQKTYNEFLLDASAIFISQVEVPFDIYFPSKLLEVMSTEQLLLVSAGVNSELYKTMKKENLALVSEYGDMNILKYHINLIINDNPTLTRYKIRAKKYVEQFDRNLVLATIMDKINTDAKDARKEIFGEA